MTEHAVDDSGKLTALLSQARYILLDFDGPVCKVFAGLPAPTIAAELRDLVASRGGDLPAELHDTGDPLAILRWAADEDDALAQLVDKALTEAEVRAVATAEPTPGAREFLDACQATGRPVAIVSNNSAEAIYAYLNRLGAMQMVGHIEGRDHGRLDLMKPSEYLLIQALVKTGAQRQKAAFIGDSVSDVQAARAAGVASIALASKLMKVGPLRESRPTYLIGSMTELIRPIFA